MFLDDFLLLEDDYNDHADHTQNAKDYADNSTYADGLFDGEAVFSRVADLVGHSYPVLTGFGDLVAESILNRFTVKRYLNSCILGRIADGYRILGRATIFYTVEGDGRSSSVYG